MPLRVRGTARLVRKALVEQAAIGRIGEPIRPVNVLDHVVGRGERLAREAVGQHRRRTVQLVADHAPAGVLAGDLAALLVEAVAVGIVARRAEGGDVSVLIEPPHLAVVGNVAPDQIPADRVPGRPLRPEGSGPEAADRAVRDDVGLEGRIEREHVWIGEVGGGRCTGAEIARRSRHRAGRRGLGRSRTGRGQDGAHTCEDRAARGRSGSRSRRISGSAAYPLPHAIPPVRVRRSVVAPCPRMGPESCSRQ